MNDVAAGAVETLYPERVWHTVAIRDGAAARWQRAEGQRARLDNAEPQPFLIWMMPHGPLKAIWYVPRESLRVVAVISRRMPVNKSVCHVCGKYGVPVAKRLPARRRCMVSHHAGGDRVFR